MTLNLGHSGNLCTQYAPTIPLPPDGPLPDSVPPPPNADHTNVTEQAGNPNAMNMAPATDPVDDFDESELPPLETLSEDEDSDGEQVRFDSGGLFNRSRRYPKGLDAHGHQWVTIVDITGVHHLPTRVCTCDPAVPTFRQFLQLGLYPVSQDRPQTVFTFRVLDDYDLTNLESKSSAQKYYSKLKRLTDNAFPHLVPDRYRELMRVAREWRNLKARQQAGISHTHEDIDSGGLVPFCPACPQPGINLPDDWEEDQDRSVYFELSRLSHHRLPVLL